jgi:hypothetical protein
MVNFTSIPAFGFETATCNAIEYYKERSKKASQKVLDFQKREMVRLNIPIPEFHEIFDITGYFEKVEEQYNNSAKSALKIANILKVVGYIPLIGTLLGIARILRAAKTTKDDLPNKFNHIARGCVELLSLGFLLLIPDLILTGYRAYHARNSNFPAITVTLSCIPHAHQVNE